MPEMNTGTGQASTAGKTGVTSLADAARPGGVRSDLGYRRLLALEGFPKLAAGTTLGRTGGQLWQIALVLFVLQRYHSPALAGLATFLSIMPGLLVSPIAGALLDRHGRVRLIQVDFGVAAAALGLLALLAWANRLAPALLLMIVAVASLTVPLSVSGTRTLFPLVVPRALWDRANAVDSGSMALASVVGPALAGFLVAWLGGQGAFLVTAGVFVAAGMVVLGVRDPHTERATPAPLLHAAGQAVSYVVRHATLRGIVIALWMTNIPWGILTLALPVLVLGRFHWGAAAVGELWSVAGIATVVAGALVGRINTEGRERIVIAVGMGLGALGVLLTVTQAPVVIVVAMLCFGLAGGPLDIGLFALRQRRTDPRWFGRVFAVSMSLNFAGMPIGSALAGPLLERSVTVTLVIAAALAIAGCAVPFLLIPREG